MNDDQRIELFHLIFSQFDDNEKTMLLVSLLDILYDGNIEAITDYMNKIKRAYKTLKN